MNRISLSHLPLFRVHLLSLVNCQGLVVHGETDDFSADLLFALKGLTPFAANLKQMFGHVYGEWVFGFWILMRNPG